MLAASSRCCSVYLYLAICALLVSVRLSTIYLSIYCCARLLASSRCHRVHLCSQQVQSSCRQNMPLREHQLTHYAHFSTWLFALVRGWHATNHVTNADCKPRFNIGGNSHQLVHRRAMCNKHRRLSVRARSAVSSAD